jgi:hypothetical protein
MALADPKIHGFFMSFENVFFMRGRFSFFFIFFCFRHANNVFVSSYYLNKLIKLKSKKEEIILLWEVFVWKAALVFL